MNPTNWLVPLPDDPQVYEDLRLSYQPTRVRLLLVGEARPIGSRFFYQGNSVLFRATQTAYARAFDQEFGSPTEFLDFFRDHGGYFINLVDRPVSHLEPGDSQRKTLRQAGIPRLTLAIRSHSPAVVVCVMKDIAPYVRAAHHQAGLTDVPLHVLRFPRYYLQSYVADLTAILVDLYAPGRK
jgi:hypothetical protein